MKTFSFPVDPMVYKELSYPRSVNEDVEAVYIEQTLQLNYGIIAVKSPLIGK